MSKYTSVVTALLLGAVLLAVGTSAAANACAARSQAVERVELLRPASKTIQQSGIKLDPAVKKIAGKFEAVPWHRVRRSVVARSCLAQKGLTKGVGTFAPFLEVGRRKRVTMTEVMAKSAACLAGSSSRNASLQAIVNVLDMTSDNFYDILVACKPGEKICQIDTLNPPLPAEEESPNPQTSASTRRRTLRSDMTAARNIWTGGCRINDAKNRWLCPESFLWPSPVGPKDCAGMFNFQKPVCTASKPFSLQSPLQLKITRSVTPTVMSIVKLPTKV